MIIRNKTGGPASLHTINLAQAVAANADVDLDTLVAGLPAANAVEIQNSLELRDAITSGAWAVVADGIELSIADGLAALTPANVRDVNDRSPEILRGTQAMTSGDPFILDSWDLGENERVTVTVVQFDVDLPASAGRARGGVYQGLGKAGRDGADAPTLMGSSFTKAENIAGDLLELAIVDDTVRLQFTVGVNATMFYELRYFATPGVSP